MLSIPCQLLQSMPEQLLLELVRSARNDIGCQRNTYPSWQSTGKGWISEPRFHPECKSVVVMVFVGSEVQLELQRCCS